MDDSLLCIERGEAVFSRLGGGAKFVGYVLNLTLSNGVVCVRRVSVVCLSELMSL